MSLRATIADHLEANGVVPVGAALYSFFDGAPDEAVAIFPYAGSPPGYVKSTPLPVMTPTRIQFVCRGKEEAAEALAERVYEAIHTLPGHGSISAMQPPFREPSPPDEQKLVRWMFNIEIVN